MGMSEVAYCVWEGEDLEANVHREVVFPDGTVRHAMVGTINIQKGDVLYRDYGASYMNKTMTGIGPEAQYPYGRVVLAGVGATTILSKENAGYAKAVVRKKFEFDEKVLEQVKRTEIDILLLCSQYVETQPEKERELRELKEKREKEQALKRKETLSKAINQMEEFFSSKGSKPKM